MSLRPLVARRGLTTVVACSLTLACLSASAQTFPSTGPSAEVDGPDAGSRLRVGDRLKLVFYERLENDEDKWRGRSGSTPRTFHQRAELSGEYVVSEEGTVTLPMLGRFQVSGMSEDGLVEALAKPFEALIDRKGYVSLTEVEHRPVYVFGPVKNPGVFRYEPGMTLVQLLALAGGLREKDADAWQKIEFGREADRLQRTLERAKRLLARVGVLQAERDGTVVPQAEMATLMGKAQAVSLVNEEAWQRNLTTMSRQAQEAALKTALGNAKAELAVRVDRLAPMDAAIAMRAERVKGMAGLAERNVIGRPVLIQAQSELSDAQDRRNQANMEMEVARKRVTDAERDIARLHLENTLETVRDTSAAKREASDALNEGQGLLDVVRTLASEGTVSDALVFEVVRRTPRGTTVSTATMTDVLRPGDVVRVAVPAPVRMSRTEPEPVRVQSIPAVGSGGHPDPFSQVPTAPQPFVRSTSVTPTVQVPSTLPTSPPARPHPVVANVPGSDLAR